MIFYLKKLEIHSFFIFLTRFLGLNQNFAFTYRQKGDKFFELSQTRQYLTFSTIAN